MSRSSVADRASAVDPATIRTAPTRTASARRGWLLVAALIVFSYNSWVLWQPLNGNPAILHGYLSELAAVDQPHHRVFRNGDLIAAALLLITAVAGLLRSRGGPLRRWWTAAYGALVLLAVSVGAGAVFPMDCSPSLDPVCADAELAGRVSLSHQLHTVAGVGVEIGLITALVMAAVAVRRTGLPRTSRLLLAMAGLEILGLAVIGGFFSARIQAISYPQIVTILNASAAGALAAVVHACPWLVRPRGEQ